LDGLAGGKTPAERLPIMRDPRIGAIGATGLFLSLLLRYAGLMALPQALRVPALVCMPALGRWAMVALAWTSPYARAEGGLAASFLTHLSWHHVVVSTGMGVRTVERSGDSAGRIDGGVCAVGWLPFMVRRDYR
jgi:adenosylcobinamide-GDP ribazoletransferase